MRSSILVIFFLLFPRLIFSQTAGDQPPQTLTLEQAVKLALERNLNLTNSQIRIESAIARTYSNFGTFYQH